MKKGLIIILISIVFVTLIGIYLLSAIVYPDWICEKFATRITALDDKYPDDLEMQMGFLFLYHPHRIGSSKYTVKDKYEKILALDPNNRAAWVAKAYRICRDYVGKRSYTIGLLESVLENAKKQKLEKIRVSSYSRRSIMDTINNKKEDEEYISIEDFSAVIEQRRKELDLELADVFEVINKGQRNDPENALYNYLKAHIYLVMGEKENAINEIEEGAGKKYLSTYQEQTSKAAEKVLSKVWFPQPHKFFTLSGRWPFEDFLSRSIWHINSDSYYVDGNWYEKKYQGLSDIAKRYESQGEFEKVEKIYNLAIAMAKQAQVEQKHPLGLDKTAEKRLEELHDKMPMEPKK